VILDEFPRNFTPLEERTINLGCYLRNSCFNRGRVLSFARGLAQVVPDSYVGAINGSSRSVGENVFVDEEYFNHLGNTKILLSCSPSYWAGDSRFAEALSSGCLLFLDEDPTPYFNKLIDGEHYISYKINDLTELRRKIMYYHNHIDEATQIAKRGQEFALEYLSSTGIIKSVLEIINERRIN
jgi:spore maturation protein CgeB